MAGRHWLARKFGRLTCQDPARSRVVENSRPRLEALEERVVPSLMGNPLFPADNPWNQCITSAPVAANSATLISSIGLGSSLHPDFGNAPWNGANNGIPYNVVAGTQAKVNVVLDAYADQSDHLPIPIPANAILEGDPSTANTSDRHLLVYDQDNKILYETFNTHRPSEEADGQWHADSEAVWQMNQNSFRPAGWTSADAAGLPILPGLVRPDEVYDQGVITHALRFTVPHSRDQFIFPASHEAGSANSAYPRMGERFRLKASFDISGFSAANRVILQALKDYGMIVADNGSSWFLSGAPSSRWDDNDLHQLTTILGGSFEAVDLTPTVTGISPASGSATGGTAVTISGLDFSGGAGQTKVFFGAVAATSVTIVSDTQISAIAPAEAAGTVDVTVQSGYGTSASVTGDRFTFQSSNLPATHLRGSFAAGTAIAGTADSLTVTALDANNNPVLGYTGTVHFTSTDRAAVLPADYTFTTADHGVHTFSITPHAAGTQTATATDLANGTITGGASVSVTPAAAACLTVTAPVSAQSGVAFSITVTLLDAFGNRATNFLSAVRFVSSDKSATLPAKYTFTAADAGVHNFTVTLRTIGAQTITAGQVLNSSVRASATVQVGAGASGRMFGPTGPGTSSVASSITATRPAAPLRTAGVDQFFGLVRNQQVSDVYRLMKKPTEDAAWLMAGV